LGASDGCRIKILTSLLEFAMKALLLISAAAITLTPPAYAQSVAEKTGVNSTLGIAPKTQDFVTEAANSDMLEIQSSKLVAGKGDTKDKAFAERMIADHTKTSADLKGMVNSGKVKVNLPSTLDSAHQSKLDALKKLDVKDFMKEYESMQVSAHKDAVSLFERYAKGGENADLKTWAGQTLPTLQDHLKMAQAND
jgi:putative membrane protein